MRRESFKKYGNLATHNIVQNIEMSNKKLN